MGFGISEKMKLNQDLKANNETIDEMNKTVKTLLWAHRKLSIYVVKERAISFILDTDFDHYI